MKNDGGVVHRITNGELLMQGNLTIRDFFAAHAMQGMLAHGICIVPTINPNEFNIDDHKTMAVISYKFSDALLAERERTK